MPNLPSDLAAIRARCEAATKGPWKWNGEGFSAPSRTAIDKARGEEVTFLSVPLTSGSCWQEDLTFIAHAREDLPLLLARLEEMRVGLEKIQMYAGNIDAVTGCRLILAEAKALCRPLDAPG